MFCALIMHQMRIYYASKLAYLKLRLGSQSALDLLLQCPHLAAYNPKPLIKRRLGHAIALGQLTDLAFGIGHQCLDLPDVLLGQLRRPATHPTARPRCRQSSMGALNAQALNF